MMDEFDSPRTLPAGNSDQVPNLEELHRQTCQLFEEFLLLEDSCCSILDEPLPASYDRNKEVADSPVENFYKDKSENRARGLVLCSSSLDDDVVPDSIGAPQLSEEVIAEVRSSIPKPASLKVPVEQDETEETEKDDKMKKLAFELAMAGDALVLEYGPTVKDAEGKLIQLVKQEATNLTYERFSTAIDGLVGEDKNWTNFVFAFCIGRRICKHSREAFTYTKGYFQQYIQSYSTTIQETGDIETFVLQRGNPMKQ